MADRRVVESERFEVFCPRVCRGPLETWVMPRERSPWFEEDLADPHARAQLAALLMPVIERLEARIAPAGYNLMVTTSPVAAAHADVSCWRLEIVPRVASLAGFELGSGAYLSTLSPEDAAAELRA